jgi:polar amino acid transport system substrate-binding protein
MEQLVQNLKDGSMTLLEVPYPALGSGQVMVRNHFSLISAGTEGKTVKDARLGYIAKARSRKAEVKKVLETARTLGLKQTYRLVMNRLDAPNALGYSCAGEIIAVAEDVSEFKPGDLVACGGSNAVHAEVVAVPVNLCARIAPGVPLEHAAFTTIGAIALQGIRQSELKLGENCVVIGLGLIGQLTLQLLRAAGIKPIGIDIDEQQVEIARQSGFDMVFNRNDFQIESVIQQLTNGEGADAVIITASSSSADPVNFAGVICRKKGKVIIVGAVPTGFDRKDYYRKELELKMSGSYGPGRYDASYEEGGIDYPYAYVRWTEQRNMQAFADLLAGNKIEINKLLTHRFPFREAKNAYQLILDRTEPFAGIVLSYDTSRPLQKRIQLPGNVHSAAKVTAGMIGAGSFGQNFLLPALKNKVTLKGVATARPNNARNVADKFGFEYCSGNAEDIIKDASINTIFIATRHDTHARFVTEALKEGKNVFTEKPLCLYPQELDIILDALNESGSRLMIGFNRRFAPLIEKLKSKLNTTVPVAINYRINAGTLPKEHWIHDRHTGGGRIIGEVCHFIDLCAFLSDSFIESVSAYTLNDAAENQDTVVISMLMENGSVASISYFSNGNKNENKELIEIYNGSLIAKLNDFKELEIITGKKEMIRAGQDKGHNACIAAFVNSINNGVPSPIAAAAIFNSMAATFATLDSIISKGQAIKIGG